MTFFKKIQKRTNRFICLFPALLIGALLAAVWPVLPARAADFKHNHTGACYTSGVGPCNSRHQQSTRSEGTIAHCSNCKAQTAHTVYVHWDHCYGTGQDFELGGYRICNTCGSNTYSWGGSSAGTHEVPQQVLSCGKSGAATGTLWFQNRTSDWTTGNVTLEAGVTIYDGGLALPDTPYSWDGQASWTSDISREITENGVYTVYARSTDGMVVGESVHVTNIDRTGPSLAEVTRSAVDWTKEDVVLTLSGRDVQPDGSDGCGLADLPYSFDGGMTYTEENTLTVSGNGSYEVLLMDRLGNVAQAQLEVSNIDREAPVISGIAAIEEGWQGESVTMQVQAEDAPDGSGLHEAGYSLDGETWQEQPEFVFTENGTYQVYVRDALGNTAVQEFSVGQLDVTAPVIEALQASPEHIREEAVLVTIVAKDIQPDGSAGSGLHEEAYSLDGGVTWQKENTFYAETGKTYDIRVRDALLWESGERIVERKDFPYPQRNEEEGSGNTQNSIGLDTPFEETEQPAENVEERNTDEEASGDEEPVYKNRKSLLEKELWRIKVNPTEETSGEKQMKTVELESRETDAPEALVQTIKRPWYTTTAGKIAVAGAGTLSVAGLLISIFFLILHSLPVYCVEEKQVLRKLGRVLMHRTREGYSVYLPAFMLQTAVTSSYRIQVSPLLLKRVENARLFVESDEKNLEVLLQETIDFTL